MSATTALPRPRALPRTSSLRPPAPRPTRPGVSAPAGLRLTRRGRLAIVALAAVLAFPALSLGQAALGAFEASAGSSAGTGSAQTWVVQPGETLWTIAEKIAPDTDPRETVA